MGVSDDFQFIGMNCVKKEAFKQLNHEVDGSGEKSLSRNRFGEEVKIPNLFVQYSLGMRNKLVSFSRSSEIFNLSKIG